MKSETHLPLSLASVRPRSALHAARLEVEQVRRLRLGTLEEQPPVRGGQLQSVRQLPRPVPGERAAAAGRRHRRRQSGVRLTRRKLCSSSSTPTGGAQRRPDSDGAAGRPAQTSAEPAPPDQRSTSGRSTSPAPDRPPAGGCIRRTAATHHGGMRSDGVSTVSPYLVRAVPVACTPTAGRCSA